MYDRHSTLWSYFINTTSYSSVLCTSYEKCTTRIHTLLLLYVVVARRGARTLEKVLLRTFISCEEVVCAVSRKIKAATYLYRRVQFFPVTPRLYLFCKASLNWLTAERYYYCCCCASVCLLLCTAAVRCRAAVSRTWGAILNIWTWKKETRCDKRGSVNRFHWYRPDDFTLAPPPRLRPLALSPPCSPPCHPSSSPSPLAVRRRRYRQPLGG